MKKMFVRALCTVSAAAASMCLLTACDSDPVVVEPVEHDKVIVITTNPETDDIMTFPLLIALNSSDLKWSDISGYRHTVGDNNTATFRVICTDDKDAELYAEFNPETDELFKADLTYGSKTVSIITDDNAVLREILDEINKD